MKMLKLTTLSTIAFFIIGYFIYLPIIENALKSDQNPFQYSDVLVTY